jgi:hypothetical protein
MEESEGDKAFFVNVVAELRWWRQTAKVSHRKERLSRERAKRV